jgi:hypothetical protein
MLLYKFYWSYQIEICEKGFLSLWNLILGVLRSTRQLVMMVCEEALMLTNLLLLAGEEPTDLVGLVGV